MPDLIKISILFAVIILFVNSSTAYSEFFPCDSDSDGSREYPYKISSASDLQNLSYLTNSGIDNYSSKNYTVVCSINLKSVDWKPIGNSSSRFKGNFDGNGYKIYNLNIVGTEINYYGLFGVAENSNLTNISVSGKIDSKYQCGLIVGNIKNGLIQNCIAEGNINSSYKYAGGLAGYADSTDIINSCFIGNVISSADYAGGIAGYSRKNIINCYSVGNISGNNSVGGIIGYVGGFNKYLNNSAALTYSVNSVGSSSGRIAGGIYPNSNIINTFAFDEMLSPNTDGINISRKNLWNNRTFFENTLCFDFENDWKMNEGNPYFVLPVPKCLKENFTGSAEYLVPDETAQSIEGISSFIFCGTEGLLLSDTECIFSADNSTVLEVTPSGNYKAKTAGTAEIYAGVLSKKITVTTDEAFREDNLCEIWSAINESRIKYLEVPKNYSVVRQPNITRGVYSYTVNFTVKNETELILGTDYFIDNFGQINLISPSGNYTYEYSGSKLGDTNKDNVVDITDAALISAYSMNTLVLSEEEKVNSNAVIGESDDELNQNDSLCVLKYIVGLSDFAYEAVDDSQKG
ncbi:MAG: hypothetical protein Q4Q53_00025 [Methanocorpusculum sp.]|nr:hypothetical protein [Methanocorpusculum sp.]